MHNILQSLKLDYFTVKPSYPKIILIYFVSVLLGLQTRPITPILIIMLLCVPFSGLPFSEIEKNDCGKLFGVLPVRRREVVIGRYLYAFISGIINLAIAIVAAYAVALLTKQSLEPVVLALSISAAFCYYCFAVGISFPIYYKTGFSKSFMFISLPLYLALVLFLYVAKKADVATDIDAVLQLFPAMHRARLLLLLALHSFAACAVMFVVSALVSCRIFRNAEL